MMERNLVWRVERVGEVDSTNRVAAERVLARWEAGESVAGMVIVAERQSAGRGQHGRRWESPAGGMYLSAVVELIPAEARAVLALVVGVAVAEAINARIRWPNDLVIGDKKVGGILCESLAQGARWTAVIGIGINVNTEVQALPPEIQSRATSLAGAGRPHPKRAGCGDDRSWRDWRRRSSRWRRRAFRYSSNTPVRLIHCMANGSKSRTVPPPATAAPRASENPANC